MSSASPALAAAHAYFDALKSYDLEALKNALTPDAVLKIYPEHLESPGGGNREEILQFVGGALKIIRDAEVEILDTCVQGTKVWALVKASATLITGEPYIHDIVYMLEVREDSGGSYKISKVTEMVDASLVPKAVELMQQQSGSCA